MKDIVVLGSGGFAKEVAFLINEINKVKIEWNFLGFIDNIKDKKEIYNNDEWLLTTKNKIYVAMGIGDPVIIEKLSKKFNQNKNIYFPNLIHPNVIGDWDRITLGKGNIICASNTFTTDISIGNFNIFNLDCTLGHDSIIGNYNVINPSVNISGGVRLNDTCLLGTGATILQNLSICSNTIIGAQALLTKNINESGIYVGNPAKFFKK